MVLNIMSCFLISIEKACNTGLMTESVGIIVWTARSACNIAQMARSTGNTGLVGPHQWRTGTLLGARADQPKGHQKWGGQNLLIIFRLIYTQFSSVKSVKIMYIILWSYTKWPKSYYFQQFAHEIEDTIQMYFCYKNTKISVYAYGSLHIRTNYKNIIYVYGQKVEGTVMSPCTPPPTSLCLSKNN